MLEIFESADKLDTTPHSCELVFAASSIAGLLALTTALLWLILKDWLFSSVQTYPMADSLAISMTVIAAAVASRAKWINLNHAFPALMASSGILAALWIFSRMVSSTYLTPLGILIPYSPVLNIALGGTYIIAQSSRARRWNAWRYLCLCAVGLSIVSLLCLPRASTSIALARPAAAVQNRSSAVQPVIHLKGGKVLRLDIARDMGKQPQPSIATRIASQLLLRASSPALAGAALGGATLALSLLFAQVLKSALNSDPRSRKRALGLGTLLAMCSASILLFSLAADNSLNPVQFGKVSWIGTGLSSDTWDANPLIQLLTEQGWISCGIVVVMMGMAIDQAVCRLYCANLTESSAAKQTALCACASSFTLIAVIPFCFTLRADSDHSWLIGVALTLSVSYVLLALTSRVLDSPKSHSGIPAAQRANRPKAVIAIGMICAAWIASAIGISAYSASQAADERATLLPQNVVAAAATEIPPRASFAELRTALRASLSLGAQTAPQSMASELVGEAAQKFPSVFRTAPAMVIGGLMVSDLLPSARITDLFIGNVYPEQAGGIAASARSFFHKPLSALSQAQVQFLVCSDLGSRYLYDLSPERMPVADPAIAHQFTYWPVPIPANTSCYHEGALNDRGEVVGAIVQGSPAGTFIWAYPSQIINPTWARGAMITDINDMGQAVGTCGAPVIVEPDGDMKPLPTPPGLVNAMPCAINDLGTVVGYAYENDGSDTSPYSAHTHALEWKGNVVHDLGIPSGYISSRALAVNNIGQVAGWMVDDHARTRAMLYDEAFGMRDLGVFAGGDVSIATSINDRGQVVGAAQHADGSVTAALWEEGQIHDLGKLPGDDKARSYSINNSGEVVGASYIGEINHTSITRAFLWDPAHGMRDIAAMVSGGQRCPGRSQLDHMSAYAVNDRGQILAACISGGSRRLVMLTPEQ